MNSRYPIFAAALLPLVGCGRHNGEVKPDSNHPVLAIGSPAPDFSLPGVDGNTHTLREYAGAKVLAILFDCNHCPESHLYDERIRRLYADYRDRGVQVVVASPDNPAHLHYADLAYSDMTDSLIDMKERAVETHIEYPFLYDGDSQSLTGKLGAVATPQIFIFDGARKLRYEGRVDDARNAFDALLAGREPAVTTTAVTGCPVVWNGKATPDPDLAKANSEPVSVTMTTPGILKKLRGNGTGRLLLVNFWATWCGPCVAEYPELQNTFRMYRGRNFGMVTVSEDVPEAKPDVLKFLNNNHASTVNYLFASDDTSAVQDSFDKGMSGAVPYTLLLGANGEVLYQEQGEISMARMRRAILANLPDDKDHPGQQAYWKSRSAADSQP